jgi:NitT/TauT family transport system substrate-binding protein
LLPRGALFAILVLVLGHLPAFGQVPAKITIGTGTAVDFLPAFVARDTGIFAKHGLDATLTIIAVPSLVPPALVSGSLQIGELTPPNIILAEAGGIELVAIAGTTRLVATEPKIALVTRAGVTVNEAQDLVGKKVGVPGFNSIIDWFLRHWLIEHRVPLDRVSIVETPMAQMGDLLKSGQLDAAAPVEPMLSRIIASGAGTRSADFFSQANPDTIGTFWGATRVWAYANRPLVDAFRASLADAVAFIGDHPDQAKAIEQKALGSVDPAMPEFTADIEPGDFDFFIKLGHQLGVLHQEVDVPKLIFPISP